MSCRRERGGDEGNFDWLEKLGMSEYAERFAGD